LSLFSAVLDERHNLIENSDPGSVKKSAVDHARQGRSRCRRLIQGQEPFKDGFFAEVGGPAVGGGNGGVEFRVAGGEPGGADIVEFGKRAVFEAGGARGVTRRCAAMRRMVPPPFLQWTCNGRARRLQGTCMALAGPWSDPGAISSLPQPFRTWSTTTLIRHLDRQLWLCGFGSTDEPGPALEELYFVILQNNMNKVGGGC
jgi:hypothetical protein